MAGKTLGYRLFRWGRVPPSRQYGYVAQGVRICDEGVPVTVTYRDFRAPGKRFTYRRSSGSGAVVATASRFAVFIYRWPILDVSRDEPEMSALQISTPRPGILTIAFEAGDVSPRCSGSVAVRLRTDRALELAALVNGDSPSL